MNLKKGFKQTLEILLLTAAITTSTMAMAKSIKLIPYVYYQEQQKNIKNKSIESNLEKKLKEIENTKGNDCKVHVYFKDLKSDFEFGYNEDKKTMLASELKPYILIGLFHLENKGLINTKSTFYKSNIRRMIEYLRIKNKKGWEVSNEASRKLLNKIGIKKLNKILKEYQLKTTIIETIPNSGREYKNKSTVKNQVELYKKLYDGKIINEKYSKKILEILAKKPPRRLIIGVNEKNIYEKIIGKTGTVGGHKGVSGIVFSKFGKYILSYAIENEKVSQGSNDEKYNWSRKHNKYCKTIANLIYNFKKNNSKKLKKNKFNPQFVSKN